MNNPFLTDRDTIDSVVELEDEAIKHPDDPASKLALSNCMVWRCLNGYYPRFFKNEMDVR